MKLVKVLTQYSALDRPFTYCYRGEDLKPGMRVFTEFNKRDIVGYVVEVEQTNETIEEAQSRLGLNLLYITRVVDNQPILNEELIRLSHIVSSYYYSSQISVLQAMLPPSLKPTKSALNQPKIAYTTFVKVKDFAETSVELTTRQQEAYIYIKQHKLVLKNTFSPYLMNKMVELDLLEEIKKEKYRYKFDDYPVEKIVKLTQDQEKAVKDIYEGHNETYLLHGVTGSGKTEVYLALAAKYLKEGKQVLILVPEIGLTGMMVAKFTQRFGDDIAIFHSELTPAEKYDEYRRIAANKVKIVVGARSAIFVPLTNIGIIILDEEHSETYKQDVDPFYHAVTIAQMRAKHFDAKVILGSATPNIETMARAKRDVYGYVRLTKRINEQQLPATTIINMLDHRNVSLNSPFISKALETGIKEALDRKEQIILLVNRRGYAPYVSCRSCGEIKRCAECGTSLTYHKTDGLLKCHHCGLLYEFKRVCDHCGENKLMLSGFGTQKAVEDIQKTFPNARILRLDSDTAKKRTTTQKILDKFAKLEADILIGTQMVAKGHDFPKVSLVGIINADQSLAFPFLRASERTFQLITQAIGRSGREKIVGRAIVQTQTVDHYVINYAKSQDYESFYAQEMKMRKLSHNPPYYFLISITLSHQSEDVVIDTILNLKANLEIALDTDAYILGPVNVLYSPIKNTYSRILVVKYRNYFKIKPALLRTIKPFKEKSSLTVKINVDPNDV